VGSEKHIRTSHMDIQSEEIKRTDADVTRRKPETNKSEVRNIARRMDIGRCHGRGKGKTGEKWCVQKGESCEVYENNSA
jgi:hypothetical protein